MQSRNYTVEEIKKMREEYLLPSTMSYFSTPLEIVRGEMQYVYEDRKSVV